jgi:hypothetical protein
VPEQINSLFAEELIDKPQLKYRVMQPFGKMEDLVKLFSVRQLL